MKKKSKLANRCSICEKIISMDNKSHLCRKCYRKVWKKENYSGRKPEKFEDYKKIEFKKKEKYSGEYKYI